MARAKSRVGNWFMFHKSDSFAGGFPRNSFSECLADTSRHLKNRDFDFSHWSRESKEWVTQTVNSSIWLAHTPGPQLIQIHLTPNIWQTQLWSARAKLNMWQKIIFLA